jgi:hypothetical protein
MKHRRLVLLIAVITMAFALTSCQALIDLILGRNTVTVSIEERITMFQETLNQQDRTGILNHLHEDMESLPNVADLSYWEIPFPYAYNPYAFTLQQIDANDVATYTYEDQNGTGIIEFTMKLEGTEYKILRIYRTLDGSPDVYELKVFTDL